MSGKKRPVIDEQIKLAVKTFGLPWYVDEASGKVQVRFVADADELMRFFWKKSLFPQHAYSPEELATIRKRKSASWTSFVEKKPGTQERDDDKSFIEIIHPELNAFIKESILGLGPDTRRSR